MGAGKTTLGKAFAREKGLSFIDLDWYIEERYHKTIRDLFREYGEDKFRIIEQKMLHEAADIEDVVISTGGGTPCFFDNIEFMNSRGMTVFLDVDKKVLFNRLRVAKTQRPALNGKSDEELKGIIDKGLEDRMKFYSKADYLFDGSHLESRKEIAQSIEKLSSLLHL